MPELRRTGAAAPNRHGADRCGAGAARVGRWLPAGFRPARPGDRVRSRGGPQAPVSNDRAAAAATPGWVVYELVRCNAFHPGVVAVPMREVWRAARPPRTFLFSARSELGGEKLKRKYHFISRLNGQEQSTWFLSSGLCLCEAATQIGEATMHFIKCN